MKLRQLALATAVPVAVCAAGVVPALASASAPKVSVRVEGTSKTLLAPRTVAAPSSGSITKAGAPSGTCPADSAAGALQAATRGDWNGTYDKGLGIDVQTILGTTASYAKGSYWEFFVDDRVASEGVCDTTLRAGEQLLFAQVPAKGTEYPLVVSAPKRVTAGEPFNVRTYYFTGKGSRTHGVSDARYRGAGAGTVTFAAPMTSVAGVKRVSASKPGTLTINASARGEIRAAPVTVKVVR